jgi:hypothetical protein
MTSGSITIIVFTLTAACTLFTDSSMAEPVTIAPTRLWPDDKGEHINAHCGGFIKVDDTYYWFGEHRERGPVQNIACYASKDLSHWTFRNLVLTPKSHTDVADSNLERPKVIYNEKTKKYVMWMHKEARRGYAEARCAVATCDSIDGDYTWVGSFRPKDNMSRDCTLFKDDDGSAYFMSSSNENADMIIYKLSDDYLSVDSQVATITQGLYREAPCLFKRNGQYYLITSFCTGIQPNPNYWSTAKSVAGPWSAMKPLCGNDTWNTYHSQAAYVLPVVGSETTSYIYCGDNWRATPMRHVWLPLKFTDDGSIAPMQWADQWQIDAVTGKCTYPEAPTLSSNDLAKGAKVTSDYSQKGKSVEYSHLAGCEPTDANDGDPSTSWVARDNLPGHWWKVDLGSPQDISGVQIQWHWNSAYRYTIETSADDATWTKAADQTENTTISQTSSDAFSVKGVRYVRVTITGSSRGYDWPGFSECNVLGSDGSDLAFRKPASADSFQANTDATKAVDGDISTAWTIDDRSNNHWLKVDLGKETEIGSCRIIWEAPGYYYQYKIEFSSDDQTWHGTVDETANTVPARIAVAQLKPVRARYVRLTLTDYERGCWPGVRAFEILPP